MIKAVRKICSALDGVETPSVTEAVKKLKRAVNLPRNKSADVSMCVDLSDHLSLTQDVYLFRQDIVILTFLTFTFGFVELIALLVRWGFLIEMMEELCEHGHQIVDSNCLPSRSEIPGNLGNLD